ncbi:hypothetical protein [Zooshikella ganghwensis]|nr:hypothetical protein [Zooshikella ganghwensis]
MNKVYDISEFTNHGNYLGDATISEGKYGLGLRLDGQGDAVVVSHDDSLSLKEEFTIAAWIAPEQSANVARQTILGKKKQL